MQRLILIRHADAERESPGGDFGRRLTPLGHRQATRVGQRLSGAGFNPDLAVISPSARTRETWEDAAAAWGAIEAREDRDLYNAVGTAPLMAVATRETGSETVALCVHNPAAHQLAANLAERAGAVEAERLARSFPKGGALVVRFDGERVFVEGLFLPKDDAADQV